MIIVIVTTSLYTQSAMQMTLYYSYEHIDLIDRVDELAYKNRKSRSQMILTILETYFHRDERIGQILVDMGKISADELQNALAIQERSEEHRPLGQILIEEGFVGQKEILRAITIQQN